MAAALKSVDRGGTILFFAATDKDATIPLSVNDIFWRNEITLTSSYAGSPKDHLDALELIARGKIKVKDMITHKLPLKDTGMGFQLVAKQADSIKVIIEP
jgi:L-iditol 2-dehydrogenase